MTHSQDRMQVQAALLRFDNGIDTPVKNSLCCAAAGITAFTWAPTGALIPHEKLRGAAPPEATLNAQSRPLAQPVLGYKPPTRSVKFVMYLREVLWNLDQRTTLKLTKFIFSVNFDSFKVRQVTLNATVQMTNCRGFFASKIFHPIVKLKSQFETNLHSFWIQLTFLNICKACQLIRKNSSTHFVRHMKVSISLFLWPKIDEPVSLRAHTKQLLRSRNLKPFHIFGSDRSLMKLLIHRNSDRYSNRQNSTNRLHPAGRVRWQPSMFHPVCNRSDEKPQNRTTHEQKPQYPKCTFNHFFEDMRASHASWVLAIKSFRRLHHFHKQFQGEFA